MYKRVCHTCTPTRRLTNADFKCWSSVVDGGPTLNQHWLNVLGQRRSSLHDIPANEKNTYNVGLTLAHRWRISIAGNLSGRKVAYSTSGLEFRILCQYGCVIHPRDVLLAQFSLYVHTFAIKPLLFINSYLIGKDIWNLRILVPHK